MTNEAAYGEVAKDLFDDPNSFSREENERIRAILEKQQQANPDDATRLALLSYVFVREAQNGWGKDRASSLAEAQRLADAAVEKERNYITLWFRGIVRWNLGLFPQSLGDYAMAIYLSKGEEPDILADMGEALFFAGAPRAAVETIDMAIKDVRAKGRDVPHWYYWNFGRAHYMAARYEDDPAKRTSEYKEAIKAIGKSPANDARLVTAAAFARLKQLDRAREEMGIFLANNKANWTVAKSAEYEYGNPEDRRHWTEALAAAGLPLD
jgi:adenylate cyclase